MDVLRHLFSSWGFVLQILAIVHLVRRRGAFFWFFIILMGGYIGAIAYILIEVVPDVYLLQEAFARFERKKYIQKLKFTVAENPSAGNLEELAELYFDQKEFLKARETFDRAISTRNDSIHALYHRGLCAFELHDFPAAIADLEPVVRSDADFDHYRASFFLARAYAQCGNDQQADALFAEVVQHATIPETWYHYASFLKSQNRFDEAREWAQKIFEKRRTMPRFVERRERPWFAKARTLLKELPS
ncbi:MAG: tetratricopeptide repeat protein [Acidobacteria bacterium]|nr:tetratricopeptide repeat protein [Acidobacteriota bacterium]MCL5287696.1 tetratricopeptide repeat protein [Acidobacteriota bacterium]